MFNKFSVQPIFIRLFCSTRLAGCCFFIALILGALTIVTAVTGIVGLSLDKDSFVNKTEFRAIPNG